jgi:hypothetical protein
MVSHLRNVLRRLATSIFAGFVLFTLVAGAEAQSARTYRVALVSLLNV